MVLIRSESFYGFSIKETGERSLEYKFNELFKQIKNNTKICH